LDNDVPISLDSGPLASSLYLEFTPIHELLKLESEKPEPDAVVVWLFDVAQALSVTRNNIETMRVPILLAKQVNKFI
jgi:hypothetical protein